MINRITLAKTPAMVMYTPELKSFGAWLKHPERRDGHKK